MFSFQYGDCFSELTLILWSERIIRVNLGALQWYVNQLRELKKLNYLKMCTFKLFSISDDGVSI